MRWAAAKAAVPWAAVDDTDIQKTVTAVGHGCQLQAATFAGQVHDADKERFGKTARFVGLPVKYHLGLKRCGRKNLVQGDAHIGKFSQMDPIEKPFDGRVQCLRTYRSVETDAGADEKGATGFPGSMHGRGKLSGIFAGQILNLPDVQLFYILVGQNILHRMPHIQRHLASLGKIIAGAGGNVAKRHQ